MKRRITRHPVSSGARQFAGKVALVTGGVSGIGRDCVRVLADAGARVVVSDVDEAQGARLMKEMARTGAKTLFVRADVTRADEVRDLVGSVLRRFGKLDFALNNAGVDGARAPTAEYPAEVWDQVIAVNLTGVFHCLKYELEVMARQRCGVIVNMASVAGLVGFVNHAAYTAAKHGVVGLTRTAALEYARHGVRVNAVCPSYTQTPMLERVAGRIPGLKARLASIAPLGRLCASREVAEAVSYLFSDAAAFITGQTLVLDGGIVAG
ncbi:MAG: SDR family oxidoreductase [Verrucomicrobia bacterium]|nr:SDR family oxidoreductase [Verrucomicrobiota bacterium]